MHAWRLLDARGSARPRADAAALEADAGGSAPARGGLGRRDAPGTDCRTATATPAEPIPEPAVNADVPPAPNLFADLARRGLPALFDSTFGVGVLLLAAFLFGAAHAFTPGHGKTLVAAYLVGERGTVKHAVILALATTIAHTGSVIAVAAILWGVYGNNVPGATQGTLQFIAGLLVIGVGLWLLMRRASGTGRSLSPVRAGIITHHDHDHDHSHPHDHGDGHHHHHGPPPESAKTTGGWLRIVLMGLGGGLVPCWDAVLLLVAASAMGRLGFAIPLLLAFSLGLGRGAGGVWGSAWCMPIGPGTGGSRRAAGSACCRP